MRPSTGSVHALELIFGCLMLVILLMGLCWVPWLGGGRIDHARITDKWKKFVKRFLPRSAANGNVSSKGVIMDVEQDGVEDGNDVEAGKAFKEGEEEAEEDQMVLSVLIGLQSRLLFTIMEESKEDLGSECGRSSRGAPSKRLSITRSWSDLGLRSSSHLQLESGPFTPPSEFKFLRESDEQILQKAVTGNRGKSTQYSPVLPTLPAHERRFMVEDLPEGEKITCTESVSVFQGASSGVFSTPY